MGKLYKESDVLVRITTTITEKERKEILNCGWEYNELIRLGILAKKDNPQLIKRIKELEMEMSALKGRIENIEKKRKVL